MIKLVVVFEGEMPEDDIDELFQNWNTVNLLHVFDNGCKVVIEVPVLNCPIEQLTDTWKRIIQNEINNLPEDFVQIYTVYFLEEFLEKDQELNSDYPEGNYGGELSYLLT